MARSSSILAGLTLTADRIARLRGPNLISLQPGQSCPPLGPSISAGIAISHTAIFSFTISER